MSSKALAFCILCGIAFSASVERVAFGPFSSKNVLIGQNGHLPAFSNSIQGHYLNPSALSEINGHESGAAFSTGEDFSNISLCYNGKSLAEKATFGAQIDITSIDKESWNSAALSVSTGSDEFSFGVAASFLYGKTEEDETLFNMDLTSGFSYVIENTVHASLSVRNILGSSLLDNDSLIVNAERSAVISIGALLGKHKEFSLLFDAMLDSLNVWNTVKIGYAAGVEYGFMKNQQLKLRAGYLAHRTEAEGEFHGAVLAGAGYLLPFMGNHIRFEYGLNFPLSSEEHSSPVHTIATAFRFQSAIDKTPPNAKMKLSAENIILGTGKNNSVQFYLDADDHNGRPVKQWMLLIAEKNSDGKLTHVKSWTGSGIPPRVIEWDGRDAAGDPVAKKVYCCRFHAEDGAGNITTLPCYEISVE
ncbi:MAG: hypothetical protein JNL74_12820 [Fibrobacteres bacterium]|nr:hypothetical protein [Fibrobacterota bacterium]